VHASLLKKARYTLGIFVRLVLNSAVTYAPPECGNPARMVGPEK